MSTGRYELIGAVSWGRNCAKSFGVYADIPCKISHFYLLVLGIASYILPLFHTIHSILQPISDYRQWVTETVGTVYIA